MHGRSDAVAPARDHERLAGDLRALDTRHEALIFDGAPLPVLTGRARRATRAEPAFYLRLISLPAGATVIAAAYLDLDPYEPGRDALQVILPHLTRGSVLAFDELGHAK